MAHVLSQPNTGFGIMNAVNTVIDAIGAARARRAVYSATYSELNALTNRELADIGVTRGEIAVIAKASADLV